jgi:hypothetical protein
MALAAVLSCYPQPVVYRVTDPRSGLPGRSQWLPTVAEVKAACEAEMTPLREAEQRRAVTERNRIIFTSGPGHDRRAAMERLRSEFPGMFDRSNEKVCLRNSLRGAFMVAMQKSEIGPRTRLGDTTRPIAAD